jgi:hypothetical protein
MLFPFYSSAVSSHTIFPGYNLSCKSTTYPTEASLELLDEHKHKVM